MDEALTCRRCAAAFVKTRRGRPPAYCSDDCRFVAWGRRQVSKHGAGGYSHGCRCDVCREAQNLRSREYFRAVGGNRHRKPEHKKGPNAPWTDKRRQDAQRRRAQKLGTQTEPINNRKVYDRDRWKCGVCRKRVDGALVYPHPKSASLDHVVPLSLDGTHTYDNVRLAHLDCNVGRGNRGGNEQLLLIG